MYCLTNNAPYKKLMGKHNKGAYTCVYTRVSARIDIRIYAKYARIICACVVRIYLSCTVRERRPTETLINNLSIKQRAFYRLNE